MRVLLDPPLRAAVADFTAVVGVRVREAIIVALAEVRVAERELNAVVLEAVLGAVVLCVAVLDAVALDFTVLCATGFDAVALWTAVFDAAVLDLTAFAAADLLDSVGLACERATQGSETLNSASARQAVIEVLQRKFRAIKKLLRG